MINLIKRRTWRMLLSRLSLIIIMTRSRHYIPTKMCKERIKVCRYHMLSEMYFTKVYLMNQFGSQSSI